MMVWLVKPLVTILFICVVCYNGAEYDIVNSNNMTTTTLDPNGTVTEDDNATWTVPTAWTPEEYPNPFLVDEQCGRRGRKSFVCDPSNVIAYEDANQLDHLIEYVRKNSPCACDSDCPDGKEGYMLSVAIVPKLSFEVDEEEQEKYDGNSVKQREIEKFAAHLRETWRFGHCDNDIVIVISRDDRKVYLAVGPKAQDVITQDCLNKFYSRARSYLQAGWYALGLESLIRDSGRNAIKGHCDDTWTGNTTAGVVLGSLFGIIVIVSVLFMLYECIQRKKLSIRRKRKFRYALSYSSDAVAQRRCPTSRTWAPSSAGNNHSENANQTWFERYTQRNTNRGRTSATAPYVGMTTSDSTGNVGCAGIVGGGGGTTVAAVDHHDSRSNQS